MQYGHILVTGGAGFVGSSLAVELKQRHPDVADVAADNLRRRGSELNLTRLREHQVTFCHCDIRNEEDLQLGGREFDLIVECSAEPSVLAGYGEHARYVINANLLGTVNCLELARRHQADLLFLSTSRVYPIQALNDVLVDEAPARFTIAAEQCLPGVSANGISEDFPLAGGSRSLYGATKLASEMLLAEYADMYGLRCVVNRCGVVAGPWQMGKSDQGVFTFWMLMHYFGRELTYIGWGGQGKQVRDVLHIADLADLVESQLAGFGRCSGQVFNVGGGLGSSLSLREATTLCQEITGRQVPLKSLDANRPADVKLYITDNGRVNQATGWSPRRGPKETLAAVFDWIHDAESLVRQTLLA